MVDAAETAMKKGRNRGKNQGRSKCLEICHQQRSSDVMLGVIVISEEQSLY
jgi:hypothetical protein